MIVRFELGNILAFNKRVEQMFNSAYQKPISITKNEQQLLFILGFSYLCESLLFRNKEIKMATIKTGIA